MMLNIQRPSVMKNIQDYTWNHCVFPSSYFQMRLSLKKEIFMEIRNYSFQSEIGNIQKIFAAVPLKNAAGLK